MPVVASSPVTIASGLASPFPRLAAHIALLALAAFIVFLSVHETLPDDNGQIARTTRRLAIMTGVFILVSRASDLLPCQLRLRLISRSTAGGTAKRVEAVLACLACLAWPSVLLALHVRILAIWSPSGSVSPATLPSRPRAAILLLAVAAASASSFVLARDSLRLAKKISLKLMRSRQRESSEEDWLVFDAAAGDPIEGQTIASYGRSSYGTVSTEGQGEADREWVGLQPWKGPDEQEEQGPAAHSGWASSIKAVQRAHLRLVMAASVSTLGLLGWTVMGSRRDQVYGPAGAMLLVLNLFTSTSHVYCAYRRPHLDLPKPLTFIKPTRYRFLPGLFPSNLHACLPLALSLSLATLYPLPIVLFSLPPVIDAPPEENAAPHERCKWLVAPSVGFLVGPAIIGAWAVVALSLKMILDVVDPWEDEEEEQEEGASAPVSGERDASGRIEFGEGTSGVSRTERAGLLGERRATQPLRASSVACGKRQQATGGVFELEQDELLTGELDDDDDDDGQPTALEWVARDHEP